MAGPPPLKRHQRGRHLTKTENGNKMPGVVTDSASRRANKSDRPQTIRFVYTPNPGFNRWTPEQAFRELIRKWRQDILRSHNLPAEKFAALYREHRDDNENTIEIFYHAQELGSEPKRYLGHIKYTGSLEEGAIEIVTKNYQSDPAGPKYAATRGGGETKMSDECLETAILVFMISPQNHRVRLRSKLFDWRFNFNSHGNLIAVKQKIPDDELDDVHEALENLAREPGRVVTDAVPERDTQLIFGEVGKGADEHGNSVSKCQVKLSDFRKWTAVALFFLEIGGDSRFVTRNGEIIMDHRFSGRLYHDDLLLDRQRWDRGGNQPLKYSYNFPPDSPFLKDGVFPSPEAQANAIFAIWDRLILIRPLLVRSLSAMLNDPTTDYADVAAAEKCLDCHGATRLWKHLTSTAKKVWYFSAAEKAENPRIDELIRNLGYEEGRELTARYWSILHRYGLLRTIEQEVQMRSLMETPEVRTDRFATEVCRLTEACLKFCRPTRKYTAVFMRDIPGSAMSFDHELRLIRIPHRWLVRRQVIEDLQIPPHRPESDVVQYSVYHMFTSLLGLFPDKYFHVDSPGVSAERGRQRTLSKIHFCLLAYVRATSQVRMHHPRGQPTALVITAAGLPDTGWARAGDVIEVQLHCDSCEHSRSDLRDSQNCSSSVQPNNTSTKSADTEFKSLVDPPCLIVRSICPPSPASYIHATFEGLRVDRTYFGIILNKSDLKSIAVVLEGRRVPDKLSLREQEEANAAHGRHISSLAESLAYMKRPQQVSS
ncbi:hypothetical protein VTK73DRAFT_8947 [Phialemonium thermophilum]|uniref:Uncharacterized protein n=1 Tax=Phialemonium thermophilum TaxID=223376 RepID=A0ABR3Y5Z7_9PEZI